MAAGKLLESVYVDRFGRGRLLPSFDPFATKKDDVQKLKYVMGNIIGLPFNEKKVNFPSYSIPDDVVHFFVFVTKEKLDYVHAQWLLDHHWIWNEKDCLNFFTNLYRLFKSKVVDRDLFEQELLRTRFHDETKQGESWSRLIPTTGEYRDLYNKGGTGNISPYTREVHLLRFVMAMFGHINDSKSANEKTYDIKRIEEDMRRMFPDIYRTFAQTLFSYARRRRRVFHLHGVPDVDELLELTSRIICKDRITQVARLSAFSAGVAYSNVKLKFLKKKAQSAKKAEAKAHH